MAFFRRHEKENDNGSFGETPPKGNHSSINVLIFTPFWVLGALLSFFLFLLWLRGNPDVFVGFSKSLFSKDTVSSTTTGEFQLSSDLYTARRHVCDVLSYNDGKREITMILRYHVNVLYDMKKVSVRVLPHEKTPDPETGSQPTETGGSEKQESMSTSGTEGTVRNEGKERNEGREGTSDNRNTNSARQSGKRIEVHLPDETMEVVTEKYAGKTGHIADGELPGIEIFDMKGEFLPKDDDRLADAFLSQYYMDSDQISISKTLSEEETVADTYLPHTSMLMENNFTFDLQKFVQEKKQAVISEARKSIVTGLGTYFTAMGYDDVVVLDAEGNPITQ